MKNLKLINYLLIIFFAIGSSSCIYFDRINSDISYDNDTRTYNVKDFDYVAIGNAMKVDIRQAANFSIEVRGNSRDLDDLNIYTNRDGKLIVKYRNWRLRRYNTEIFITMPKARGLDFSGAVDATVKGFKTTDDLDILLSGASNLYAESDWGYVNIDLSGASNLKLYGKGSDLVGDLSGASRIEAFDFPVAEANLDLSGSSDARVWVNKLLRVSASGASTVRFRGNATVKQTLSGGSQVYPD